MRSTILSLVLTATLVACGGESAESRENGEGGKPASAPEPTTSSPAPSAESSSAVVELEEGVVAPGRYRFTIRNVCEKWDPIGCPRGTKPPPPLDLKVTVPAGWQHWWEFGLLTPAGDDSPTEGPDGAALVMGWTTFMVGLNSDPCITDVDGHEIPDVKVGPGVDDFVRAVQAQKALDVTEPTDTMLGGYPARFFTLEGPADLRGCDNWRPWDPGFHVQGPNNHWDVWVVDVEGDRVLIVTQYFPDTPAETVAQLEQMAQSIRFRP